MEDAVKSSSAYQMDMEGGPVFVLTMPLVLVQIHDTINREKSTRSINLALRKSQ